MLVVDILAMRSDKPNAKFFRQWVIHKVLPQIRKQGFYSSNQYISEMFEIIAQKLPHSQKNFHVKFEIYDKNTHKKCSVFYEVGNPQNKIEIILDEVYEFYIQHKS